MPLELNLKLRFRLRGSFGPPRTSSSSIDITADVHDHLSGNWMPRKRNYNPVIADEYVPESRPLEFHNSLSTSQNYRHLLLKHIFKSTYFYHLGPKSFSKTSFQRVTRCIPHRREPRSVLIGISPTPSSELLLVCL